ncbi:glycosyl hydrolase family 18 protein [Tahibacter amnicola]|uniref:Glycosyl hydrolase family 18 protein n=1 Tax=Tahibacter amnicola TaxID=2976241 RepID=A0ABY6BAJ0_9GAMM|nr:glycosyl hydrolase family 18 protein [Tahibacter amnicola]UXI66541.1 glycosyl hydrolase family 18 protein [Tahibacter amnicola]
MITARSRHARLYAAAIALVAGLSSTLAVGQAVNHDQCRPDGMKKTAGVNTPYCLVYDANGREQMGAGHPRRIIGYFTSWRTGANNAPRYLASDIPWTKITHINYAFAHVDENNRVSIGNESDPQNPATGLQWPGVAGATMDPEYAYKGHFNLLNKFKKTHPNVKTLVSVGGWAETGGYFDATGARIPSGGFFTMTVTPSNQVNQAAINTFADSAVAFVRRFGFNGVDIDYEYATSMNNAGNPLDWSIANPRRAALMQGYVALMKTLREKLDAASAQDNKYYLLTVAAPASGYLLRGMETYQVTQYLDYVNIMSYDLHGAWNEFVGPNAALYDDGRDAELVRWNVYSTPQYGNIGYLNTDWAYHYFRGAMPAGRINIGVPYYTRGWRNVSGGTNGLWGTALQSSGCPTGLTTCGQGAVGIDNLWHDLENGQEMPAGSNPLWHAKNLQQNILPSYIASYGLDPTNDPDDRLTGTYTRHYDTTLVSPWLWNAQKNVFLSTEDDESTTTKANYIVNKGIGGVMFWELAGDYAWHPVRRGGQGEYFIGTTLTDIYFQRFQTASPYGNRRVPQPITVAGTLDATITVSEFDIGDSNYPISPKLKIVNNSTTTIPAGAQFEFDAATTAPANWTNWSGATLAVHQTGHSGSNVGGLQGDFHRARLSSSWSALPPGGSMEVEWVYYLPMVAPSNWTVTFGGSTYALRDETASLPPTDVIFRNGFQSP